MNRETAWMIRQDGKAFACTSHYYADSEDAEDTLMPQSGCINTRHGAGRNV